MNYIYYYWYFFYLMYIYFIACQIKHKKIVYNDENIEAISGTAPEIPAKKRR